VRERLLADGSLYSGYHPEMEAVRRRNAARLREIVAEFGWPGRSLVGDDGAVAAWRVAQHAIGEPDFMRECLRLVEAAAAADEVPAWQAAYLLDRIRVFEGRPQRYATQFDVGDDGWPVPAPLEDPDGVDERRRSVGLEPLADQMSRAERSAPRDREERERFDRRYEEWLREVGWRK